MRIISNFKDYYDGFQDYDKSYINKCYVRETTNCDEILESSIIKKYNFWLPYSTRETLSTDIYIIGGKYVPLALLENTEYGYYKIETTKKLITNYNELKELKPIADFWEEETWINFFKERDLTELCLALKCPLIKISGWGENINLILNPFLKDSDITKIYGGYQLYQELDYFVSNVMVNDELKPTRPLTDIEKLESKGFDKKISFRKQKAERK